MGEVGYDDGYRAFEIMRVRVWGTAEGWEKILPRTPNTNAVEESRDTCEINEGASR